MVAGVAGLVFAVVVLLTYFGMFTFIHYNTCFPNFMKNVAYTHQLYPNYKIPSYACKSLIFSA
jgi:hypothetical protein